MSTQIKRLYQSSTEFVPITLAEAVVVNTSNIVGLSSLGITTLDKVLRVTMGVVGTNSADIDKLETTVEQINSELKNKQDKLTAGAGITITPEGVISATNSVELYKIVRSLPQPPSKEHENSIYLVPNNSGVSGNAFIEYICIYEDNLENYVWEEIGKIQTDVDLSGYVTKSEFNSTIQNINTQLSQTISARNVTTSTGTTVVVNYDIPNNLYDSAVSTDQEDLIIGN